MVDCHAAEHDPGRLGAMAVEEASPVPVGIRPRARPAACVASVSNATHFWHGNSIFQSTRGGIARSKVNNRQRCESEVRT